MGLATQSTPVEGDAAAAARRPDAVILYGDGLPRTPELTIGRLQALADSNGIESDSYALGGVVEVLEERFAAILGKETAAWMPTGTLANHLAVRRLCGGRPRAIVQEQSHLYHDEGDGLARLSGINVVPLAPGRPAFTVDELEQALDEADSGRVANAVGCVVIESPVRRQAGQVVPFDEMVAITALCRDRGIGTHFDGARLYMMSAATGVSIERYAALFDTVYVSLYKYLGAPIGAVVAGPTDVLDGLYHERRMFGGGVASAALPAALAMHGLDGFEERFAQAMSKGRDLFADLSRIDGVAVEAFEHGSNIFELRLNSSINYELLRSSLMSHGVVLREDFEGWPAPLLSVNETILRRENAELVAAFEAAVSEAGGAG